MNNVNVIGIDLSKKVFQVHASDASGKVILRKSLSRKGLLEYLSNMPPCTVAMEACGSSHYWGRTAKKMGHTPRLISPQFVTPYVKSNKNDRIDSEAIVEAQSRPSMRYVPVKETWQQDILMVHRIRERLVKSRTALMNEIRGLLSEYGIVIPRGRPALRKKTQELMGENDAFLSPTVKGMMVELYEELGEIEKRILSYEAKIIEISNTNDNCRRLETIPGIGPTTSTALVASVGDPKLFKNGRQMSAWLGLVPKQSGTGGKTKLFGISKRGDKYLRKLLVHGARTVLRHLGQKTDRRSRWLIEKSKTIGFNKTCVALANKNARTAWALLNYKTEYRTAHCVA